MNMANGIDFLSGANAAYIADLYERYSSNPGSVDPQWALFFRELKDEPAEVKADHRGAPWGRNGAKVIGAPADEEAAPRKGKGAPLAGGISKEEVRARTLDSIRALMLIRAYRIRGHLMAKLDPLGLREPQLHAELDPATYGFTEADMDREIFIDNVLGLETAPLREILRLLQDTYCGHIGVEFMHIQDPDQKAWIQRRIEGIRNKTDFTEIGRRAILERLTEAEGFEKFLQIKYTGTKRFGLEGGESLLPAIEQILKRGSQLGVEEVVLGMAHRGRLNVLANVMRKPYQQIFAEFQGASLNPEDVQGSGDVKYHLGTSADRDFDGKIVHLSLAANPSHLEAVDPVVLGRVRAKQRLRGDLEEARPKVLGLLLHGDAAIAGQGVVAECFALSQLRGYRTGGTIHIVINNQIGFTTSPEYARSGHYASDIAKVVMAPIFHVNGDDPEAVVHAARIATEFRQEFQADVVVDMVCYRRHGHNESDEPSFTQPKMYGLIAAHPTTREIYSRRLVEEGVLGEAEPDEIAAAFTKRLEDDYQAASSFKLNKADWLEGQWKGLEAARGEEEYRQYETSAAMDALQEVGRAISTVPDGFNINSKIARQMKAKAEMMAKGEGFDWATAEALAFGTLALEGHPVRLSGQDSGRGTFSQRHMAVIDQETEAKYLPLANIREGQAWVDVFDSPLSEMAVLGFEYGFSSTDPRVLTMWEAQFGDFANGAQVIIDQFIASCESKWLRFTGVVMLLPHGYEGQGPEHSSARLERYLQLCAEDNIQVVYPTTPANYFHVLRRQVRRNFRKPLVVMTPKSLLRHKLCVSTLAEMGPGSHFNRVYAEQEALVADKKVRRIVLCSGKVYYDLLQARTERDLKDVALVRVEQLYPWPKDTVAAEIARYPNAEVVWCQEEPANAGAWTFVDRRLTYILQELDRKQRLPLYVGRKAAASPATGSYKVHNTEQARIVEDALQGDVAKLYQPFQRTTALGRMGN